MSCYSCLTKFSIFTKEQSCPNCGLSFCTKCLKLKAVVGEEEKNVCRSCYKKINSDVQPTTEFDTPDLLLKRLETLENPAKPPITIFRHSARLVNLKYGLSSEDQKILERLERLKADHKASAPDENEIKRRLALLQDKNVETMSKPQKLESAPKSYQEEVDELLKQYVNETGIQTDLETSGSTKSDEIESRLRKLQMSESTAMNAANTTTQEMEDEDSETLRIIKRAIAEGQLERKLRSSTGKSEDSDISDMEDNESEPEYPWCIICNENAVLKCFGCDGSLYCNICFKQGHEFFNMEDHKCVPYKKKIDLDGSD